MKEGTLVAVWRDNGQVFITTTSSEVYELGRPTGAPKNYRPGKVVHLNGVSGYYAISHVRPITGKNIHPSAIMVLGAAVAGEI